MVIICDPQGHKSRFILGFLCPQTEKPCRSHTPTPNPPGTVFRRSASSPMFPRVLAPNAAGASLPCSTDFVYCPTESISCKEMATYEDVWLPIGYSETQCIPFDPTTCQVGFRWALSLSRRILGGFVPPFSMFTILDKEALFCI